MTDERSIDLREIPHQQRHALIFMTFDQLTPGSGFEIINDHNPGPLRRQFEMIHGDDYGWEYLEEGPAVWRIRISRRGKNATEAS